MDNVYDGQNSGKIESRSTTGSSKEEYKKSKDSLPDLGAAANERQLWAASLCYEPKCQGAANHFCEFDNTPRVVCPITMVNCLIGEKTDDNEWSGSDLVEIARNYTLRV